MVDQARGEYLRLIETMFLETRGRGLMLSPTDIVLVDQWRERGLPVHVVIRELRAEIKRFRDNHPPRRPVPHSLSYFSAHMDKVLARWHEHLLAGCHAAHPNLEHPDDESFASLRDRALARIEALGSTLEEPRAKQALRRAWTSFKKAEPDQDIWTLTAVINQKMVGDLVSSLEEAERQALEAQLSATISEADLMQMSPTGLEDTRQAEIEGFLYERFGLVDLVELLIEPTV